MINSKTKPQNISYKLNMLNIKHNKCLTPKILKNKISLIKYNNMKKMSKTEIKRKERMKKKQFLLMN